MNNASVAIRLLLCLLIGFSSTGCSLTNQSISYLGEEEMGYYRDVATKIEYPVLEEQTEQKAFDNIEPRRIRHPKKEEIWDITLIEALHTALDNNSVMREASQFLSPFNTLMRNPNGTSTVYDPALQESNVQSNQRGVEAALADFDAQYSTSILWGRDENVQNNRFTSGGLAPGDTLIDETTSVSSRLQKQLATGGSFTLSNSMNYARNNSPTRLFQSVYTDTIRAEFRQPLRAGAGIDFTRIAGPIGSNINSGLGSVDRGVVIARINTDIAVADFEINVRNMLNDVEVLYWDLSQAYRVYDSEVKARDTALKTYTFVGFKANDGLSNTKATDKIQAKLNYSIAKSNAESALADLYDIEGRLRRIMGLPVNDGRIIRPVDEPTTKEFKVDWESSKLEALSNRVELRKQKWEIKKLELALKAARNLNHSRFDFVANYRVNGFGDNLIKDNDDDGVTDEGYNSAIGSLTQGNQTGYNLGFEFSKVLGNRAANSQVRFYELSIMKARKILSEQEMEVVSELADSFRKLDASYQRAETKFNQRIIAEQFVRNNEISYNAGLTELDFLLRAQVSLTQAETDYYRSIIEYNKAVTEIHFRKGTLLQHNNVSLAEGDWDGKAYDDAEQRAWERTYALKGKKFRNSKPFPFVEKPDMVYDFDQLKYVEVTSGTYMESEIDDIPVETGEPLLPVPGNEQFPERQKSAEPQLVPVPEKTPVPVPRKKRKNSKDKVALDSSDFSYNVVKKNQPSIENHQLKEDFGPILIRPKNSDGTKTISQGWKTTKSKSKVTQKWKKRGDQILIRPSTN